MSCDGLFSISGVTIWLATTEGLSIEKLCELLFRSNNLFYWKIQDSSFALSASFYPMKISLSIKFSWTPPRETEIVILNIPRNQWVARDVPYIHPSAIEEPISRRRPRLLPPAEVRIIVFEFIDSGAPRGQVGGGQGEVRGHARGRRRRRTWRYQGVLYESVYEVWYRGEHRSPFRPPEVVARCETNPGARLWNGAGGREGGRERERGDDREPAMPGPSRNKSRKRLVLIVRRRSPNLRAKRNFRNLKYIANFSQFYLG